jgi:hypothetical protein
MGFFILWQCVHLWCERQLINRNIFYISTLAYLGVSDTPCLMPRKVFAIHV